LRRSTCIIAVFCMLVLYVIWLAQENPVRLPDHTTPKTVIVQPGDTLWRIVSREYPDKDPREMIYLVQKANRLDSGYIYPGQVLALPGGKEERPGAVAERR